jgi:hypothetical protein
MAWQAAAIMAGANLLGGHLRNKEAKSASARQMAFQREMSDTAYQRAMKDMRKAGLNPILAGKLGGASTPTGSTYNPINVGGEAVKGAMTGAQIQGAMATARELNAKADMAEMDRDYFEGAKIAPVMAKNTGLNLMTSEAWEAFKKLPKTIQDKIMQSANSARDYINSIKAFQRRGAGPDTIVGSGGKKRGESKKLLNIGPIYPNSYK